MLRHTSSKVVKLPGASGLPVREHGSTEHGNPVRRAATADAHQWAIVLAGGAGKRIRQWTLDGEGNEVPKQFGSLLGGQTLLGATLARASCTAAPSRVVTVVRADHERFWRREFHGRAGPNVVVQPMDRGTGAGVLLPLLRVMSRDPKAVVTLMPSDHFVTDGVALERAIRSAQAAVARDPRRAVLLGMPADRPDTDYGWIVPGKERDGVRPVLRFVEKPTERVAGELLRAGAVWNSFLLVGFGWTLLDLFDRRLPGYADAFLNMRVTARSARLDELYEAIPPIDFTRDVLQASEQQLAMQVVPECGWTDLGTPARLAACVDHLRQAGRTCSEGSMGAAFAARPAPSVLRRAVSVRRRHA